MTTLAPAKAAGLFGRQRAEAFLSSSNAADFEVLRDLMQRKQLRSAIDRTYPFAQAADAIATSRPVGRGTVRRHAAYDEVAAWPRAPA